MDEMGSRLVGVLVAFRLLAAGCRYVERAVVRPPASPEREMAGVHPQPIEDLVADGDWEGVRDYYSAHPDAATLLNNEAKPPLEVAIDNGLVAWVDILLDFNADPTADLGERNAISKAGRFGEWNIVALFEDRGYSLDAVDSAGESLLHYSLAQRDIAVTKWLLDKGVDPNRKTTITGKAPLFYCIDKDPLCSVLFRLLLESGAEIDTTSNRGTTLVSAARFWGNKEVIQLIESEQKK